MEQRQQIGLQKAVKESFPYYVGLIRGKEFFTPFHLAYYRVLNEFAHGRIKRLIITVPPQHGKSEGSTLLLPSYLLGVNPNMRIAIASYSDSFAKKFNRGVQRIIDTPEYRYLFPETVLNGNNNAIDSSSYLRNSSEFEIVGKQGSLKAIGRSGAITGNTVDCFILDDLYKNSLEGNSPIIRDSVVEWYTSTVKTRLHNNSQELIVFTRWHEEDLIGRLQSTTDVRELKSLDDVDENFRGWLHLNFEAIKRSSATELDDRQVGEPLWGSRHSLELLEEKRALDPLKFDCMYQGYPSSKEGLLYSSGFGTYTELPNADEVQGLFNYTDTADMGDDYLCSICYIKTKYKIYVTDIIFSREPMEVTEPMVADMLKRTKTTRARIESNNGGRSFARAVQKLAPRTKVEWFHQGANKESRILTHSASVQQMLIFPQRWKLDHPEFYSILTGYKRQYRSNRWHDAADVVTGIVEEALNSKGKIKAIF
ncbi:MAG: phage terminase large subunit [Rikenellaceae bacterium]